MPNWSRFLLFLKYRSVCAYQHFDGKIGHDAELVPDEIGAEGDGQYRKALEVEGLAIASDHPHVSRVSNWGCEGESIVNKFIDEITDLTGICQYPDGQSLNGSEYEKQLHSWSPGVDSGLIAGRAGSMTCTGDSL